MECRTLAIASPPTSAIEQLALLQGRWRRDWRTFYYETLGGTILTEDQEAVWDHVCGHMRTLVTSGHATGKDFDIGRIVPYFLFSYAPAIVITTAPTDRQVERVIWGEIHAAAARAKYPLGGSLLGKSWTISEKHYAIGFTSKDTQSSSQHFSGFHERNVLIILSEAPGINAATWSGLEGVTTGEHVRILAVGQAIGEAGDFYDAWKGSCRRGPQCPCLEWHHMQMSSWDAAEANERLQIPALASKSWCEQRRRKWGEDHPLYVSRVLGGMPESGGDRVIPIHAAMRAQELELPTGGPCGMGIDVAWRGEDDSVIAITRGQRLTRLVRMHGQNTLELASRAAAIVREERELYPDQRLATICVDVGGVGAGVYDQLWALSEELGLSVIGVNFGTPANRDEEYFDKGAEMWWQLREELKLGTAQLLPQGHPEAEELIAELTARQLSKRPDKLGRIRLESKQEMRSRGVASPDAADGYLLAREACRQQGSPLLASTVPDAAVGDGGAWVPV